MNYKIYIISIVTWGLFFGAGIVNKLQAQQDSQYTQYMYNTTSINPAYAGNREVLSINSLYRTQWVGLEGGPKTLSFSINTPIGDSPMGIGLSVVQDQIGPANETFAAVDFSYSIKTSNYTTLCFGLKGYNWQEST